MPDDKAIDGKDYSKWESWSRHDDDDYLTILNYGDLLFFKIIVFDFQNELTNLKRLTTFSILQKVNDILAWTRLFRRLLDFRQILDLEKF